MKILAKYGVVANGYGYASSFVPVGQYDEGEVYFAFLVIEIRNSSFLYQLIKERA